MSIWAEQVIYEPLFLYPWVQSVSFWEEEPNCDPGPGTKYVLSKYSEAVSFPIHSVCWNKPRDLLHFMDREIK